MRHADPRVDAYIEDAPEFARPILERVRRAFHRACPDIEERIKWGVPSFERKGLVGGMAAFQRHVGFGFWKARLMKDPAGIFVTGPRASPMAVKASKVSDLPPERVLVAYVREAVALNEQGVKEPRAPRKHRPEVAVPPLLAAALAKNARARKAFEAFPPSHRREYCEWIAEAKREETRARRVKTAIAWMSEGKSRHWKYAKQ